MIDDPAFDGNQVDGWALVCVLCHVEGADAMINASHTCRSWRSAAHKHVVWSNRPFVVTKKPIEGSMPECIKLAGIIDIKAYAMHREVVVAAPDVVDWALEVFTHATKMRCDRPLLFPLMHTPLPKNIETIECACFAPATTIVERTDFTVQTDENGHEIGYFDMQAVMQRLYPEPQPWKSGDDMWMTRAFGDVDLSIDRDNTNAWRHKATAQYNVRHTKTATQDTELTGLCLYWRDVITRYRLIVDLEPAFDGIKKLTVNTMKIQTPYILPPRSISTLHTNIGCFRAMGPGIDRLLNVECMAIWLCDNDADTIHYMSVLAATCKRKLREITFNCNGVGLRSVCAIEGVHKVTINAPNWSGEYLPAPTSTQPIHVDELIIRNNGEWPASLRRTFETTRSLLRIWTPDLIKVIDFASDMGELVSVISEHLNPPVTTVVDIKTRHGQHATVTIMR